MARRVASRLRRAALSVLMAALAACGADTEDRAVQRDADPQQASDSLRDSPDAITSLRYDREYPALRYSDRTPVDAVTMLAERINNAEAALTFDPEHGYLDALLSELAIDASSQLLVFSRTSLQVEGISAATPRAIYFNDDVYVAWVPGAGSIEIAAMDPVLGPVFYTLSQTPEPVAERRFGLCLGCHDSLSLTGGGVPRFITGSGYIGKDGTIVAHEGWILTNDRTPLRSRWGGWYVSGIHGGQEHLGNIAVDSIYDLENLESLRNGNYTELSGLLDTSRYMTDKSDVVSLLVFEHQTTVQNAIVRLNWDARQGNEYDIEPLVRALVMDGTPALTDRISGTAGFEQAFLDRATRDTQGRSLRDLDLETRLFRYPLSFVVDSAAFAALPDAVLRAVLRRVEAELSSRGGVYEALPGDARSRAAAWEIFLETHPEFAAMLAQ